MRTDQNQNFRRQSNRGGYRGNYRNKNYERGRSRSRERIIQVTLEGKIKVAAIGQGQDQEEVLIET